MKIFIIVFAAALFALNGCKSTERVPVQRIEAPEKKAPTELPPSPRAQQEFSKARKLVQKSQYQPASVALKKFLQTQPTSSLTPEAWYLLGTSYSRLSAWEPAYQAFVNVVRSPVLSPRESESALLGAQSALKAKKPEDSLSIIDWAVSNRRLADGQVEVERIRYQAFLELGKKLLALQTASRIIRNGAPSSPEKDSFRAQGTEIVTNQLGLEELESVRTSSAYDPFRSIASFRLAQSSLDAKDLYRARSYLGQIDVNESPELAERARRLIDQIDARSIIEPNTIGVVLPLTGDQSEKGYRALNGIQHALGIFSKRSGGIKLAVIDSEGNADVARRAIERLVVENHVIGIIGGFLSKTASVEAAKAQDFGVPIILLSQKSGLTQTGEFVFRNALTSQAIASQVARTAIAQGLKKFAIIFPNDPYGVEYANLFWTEVRNLGGEVVGAQPYDPKETDFRAPIQRLVGLYYGEDRYDEYRLLLKQREEKGQKKSVRQGNTNLEDIVSPVVDFDAVFIPDSPKNLSLIAPMLAYFDVKNARLIGTNIWNNPALLNRGEKFAENSLFADAFAFADKSFASSDFFSGFKASFGREPSFFEMQAYEAASILLQQIRGGEVTRIGLQRRLAGLDRFSGPSGFLQMSSNRELERRLVSLTVLKGKIVPIDAQIN